MRKTLIVLLALLPLYLCSQQNNYPVTGISDKRIETYGFKDLVFPKGTIVTDLTGKIVYPSFIDIYACNFGVKVQPAPQPAGMPGAGVNMTQLYRMMGMQQTSEPSIADYWNDSINASYDVSSEFIPDQKTSGEFRQAGFGAVLTFKSDGLARGTSALVTTGDDKANNLILKNRASANYSFSRGRSSDMYPNSQFGIIALLRQLNYDAQWYRQLPSGYFHDNGIEAYLSGLTLPQIFEVSDNLEVMRAVNPGKEFNINYIVKGSGDEYQSLPDVVKSGCKLIVPVEFPSAPDVKDPYAARTVPFTTLKHYEMAPANPAFLFKAGVVFALTSSGLERRNDFLVNIRKAIKYGLPEAEALKALTYTPALLLDALYKADDGVILGWPARALASRRRTYDFPGGGSANNSEAYNNSVEQLEKIFSDAQAYSQLSDPPDRNLRLEALKGLFDGSKQLYINAPDPSGIISAVTFAKRYGVKRVVLTDADESAWAVKDFLKENNIPIILAHVHALPKFDDSDIRLPFKLAAMFMKEGLLVGLTYENQAYGYNLPFVAGQTVAYGLSPEEALQTVTYNNARILGIDNVTGAIETGKDANIVVSTGDLLDMMTNNVEYAFISGRNLSLDNKHKQLYRRFREKYNTTSQGK